MASIPYPAQAQRKPAPTIVVAAALLLWLLAGLLVLRAVLTFVLFDSLVDSWYESRAVAGVPREIIEDGAPAYRQIALGSAILFGGLIALAAAFLPRGARWARILATVVGGFAFLGGLSAIPQPAVLFTATGLTVAVAAVVAVVALWLPGSSAFFRARKAAG